MVVSAPRTWSPFQPRNPQSRWYTCSSRAGAHQPLPSGAPLAYVDVVDDFMQLMQGSRRRRKVARRILMHTIDELIEGTSPDHPMRKKPCPSVSSRKVTGPGSPARSSWSGSSTRSTNLGIASPPRMERIEAIFDALRGQRPCRSRNGKRYGRAAVRLRGHPRESACSAPSNWALQRADQHRIRVTRHVRSHR